MEKAFDFASEVGLLDSIVNEEKQTLLKPETVLSDMKPSVDDSSRKPDANESQKPNTSVAIAHDAHLLNYTIAHGDGSDELVDVNICDICGDAGREALLALCSTCSDGAEHIYCMRNKMDKVPESGWMCEECIEMRELRNSSQVVASRAVSPLNPTCSEKFSQSLPKISLGVKEVAETSRKHLGRSFSTPGKRRAPLTEMSSARKKKAFGNNVSPPRSPCGVTKTQFRCDSSKSDMHMGKCVVPAKRAFEQAFSSGNKSPKLEKRFCKGHLSTSKPDDMSELHVKVQQSKDDVLPCIESTRESADGKLEKVRQTKLYKSLSITGSAPPCVSNVPSSNNSKLKDLRDLTKKYDVRGKNNRLYLPSTSSCAMRVCSPRTKVASKSARAVHTSDKNAVQVCGNVKAQTSRSLAQDGKEHANLVARSAGNKSSPGHSGDVIVGPAKDSNSDCGQKAIHPTRKAELHSTVKDHSELHPVKPMPTQPPAKAVLPGSSAIPAADFIWKGGFEMVKCGKLPKYCNRIQAHLSTCSSSKVHEVVSKFGPKLVLREAPRLETWPTHFRSCGPTEQDIALYFFAEDRQSYGKSYKTLLDGMMANDLVLEASFDGVQLIVLSSSLLPTSSRKWNSLHFLWGVCRARKINDHIPHLPGLDALTLNNNFRKSDTCGLPNKCVSTCEAEKSSSSQTFQAPEAADALLLLSSASTKFSDRSRDHDVFSKKCFGAQEESDIQPDTAESVHSLKKEASFGRALQTNDMLRGVFPSDNSYGENTVPQAINSIENRFYNNGFFRDPSIPLVYYPPTSASRSSISIDSGPCGSSDGCARSSDEAHGEQPERPPNFRTLNLDLCLGSPEDDHIDLNLGLGFPSRYQPKQLVGGGNNVDLNMSLALSL